MAKEKVYCISGPSSTGKSALLNKLRGYIDDAIFVEDQARRVFNAKYRHRYANLEDLMNSDDAVAYHLELAFLAQNNRVPGTVVVVDRAPIDILVYSLMIKDKVKIIQIMDIVLEAMCDVDLIFMTRDNGSCENGGSIENRRLERSLFNRLGNMFAHKLEWLPDTIEARVGAVFTRMAMDEFS